MKFSVERFDCQVAMRRARESARRERRRFPPFPAGMSDEEKAEVVRTRIAVQWCGSREKYDEIFADFR